MNGKKEEAWSTIQGVRRVEGGWRHLSSQPPVPGEHLIEYDGQASVAAVVDEDFLEEGVHHHHAACAVDHYTHTPTHRRVRVVSITKKGISFFFFFPPILLTKIFIQISLLNLDTYYLIN